MKRLTRPITREELPAKFVVRGPHLNQWTDETPYTVFPVLDSHAGNEWSGDEGKTWNLFFVLV